MSMKKRTFLVVCTIAAAFTTIAAPAAAQQPKPYDEKIVDGNQVVKFGDDDLPALPYSAYGDTIRRPPGVTRVGLIRPRMNFVMELLKSVENL
jgi:hypothetical protein